MKVCTTAFNDHRRNHFSEVQDLSDNAWSIEENTDDAEKIIRLKAQVCMGWKRYARWKKKTVVKVETTDEKELQAALQKIRANQILNIDVNLFKDDGSVIHFNNLRAQALSPTTTFALHGHYENKQLMELLHEIANQIGTESISRLDDFA